MSELVRRLSRRISVRRGEYGVVQSSTWIYGQDHMVALVATLVKAQAESGRVLSLFTCFLNPVKVARLSVDKGKEARQRERKPLTSDIESEKMYQSAINKTLTRELLITARSAIFFSCVGVRWPSGISPSGKVFPLFRRPLRFRCSYLRPASSSSSPIPSSKPAFVLSSSLLVEGEDRLDSRWLSHECFVSITISLLLFIVGLLFLQAGSLRFGDISLRLGLCVVSCDGRSECPPLSTLS